MTVHVTVVMPSGNVVPDAFVHDTVGCGSDASFTTGAKLTAAPAALVAIAVRFTCVMVGGALRTVTTNVFGAAALPRLSVAVQLTVVGPTRNRAPEAGLHATARLPSTRSSDVAVYVTLASLADVAPMVKLAGTVTAGGVVSTTVTVNDPETVAPRVLVAVQYTVVVLIGKIDPDAGVQLAGFTPSVGSLIVAV